jgi:hypothetical protein
MPRERQRAACDRNAARTHAEPQHGENNKEHRAATNTGPIVRLHQSDLHFRTTSDL